MSSPVSRMALRVAGPQIALISRTVSVTACGVAGGEAAPGDDEVDLVGALVERLAGVGAGVLARLLAGGEVHHRGDADAGAGELGAGLGDEARPDADGGDRPVRGAGAAAEVGDGGGVAGVVEVGEVEAGERPARRRSRRPSARPRQVVGGEGAGQERADAWCAPARPRGRRGSPAVSGGANSASFCRQPPQGEMTSGPSASTSTSAMRVLPGGDHGGDGAGLGAGALRVGDVLDVAAGEDAAVRAADGSAHLEAGIGGVGVAPGAAGGVEEIHARPSPVSDRGDYGHRPDGLASGKACALAQSPGALPRPTGCPRRSARRASRSSPA